jgi:hypothetical protein
LLLPTARQREVNRPTDRPATFSAAAVAPIIKSAVSPSRHCKHLLSMQSTLNNDYAGQLMLELARPATLQFFLSTVRLDVQKSCIKYIRQPTIRRVLSTTVRQSTSPRTDHGGNARLVTRMCLTMLHFPYQPLTHGRYTLT